MESQAIATPLADPNKIICVRCYNSKDRSAFPNPTHTQRYSICSKCAAKSAKDKGASRELIKEAVKGAVRHSSGSMDGRINSPHVSELAEGLITQFGGLAQFCKEWHYHITVAMKDKPGSKTVLDAFKIVANVVNSSTKHRQSAPDMEELSDAELEAAVKALMMQQNVIEGEFEVKDDGPETNTAG
jgi:ribosomal protein L40E